MKILLILVTLFAGQTLASVIPSLAQPVTLADRFGLQYRQALQRGLRR